MSICETANELPSEFKVLVMGKEEYGKYITILYSEVSG